MAGRTRAAATSEKTAVETDVKIENSNENVD